MENTLKISLQSSCWHATSVVKQPRVKRQTRKLVETQFKFITFVDLYGVDGQTKQD